MTGEAVRRNMRTRQRESGVGMIKGGRRPRGRAVAVLAGVRVLI